MESRAPVSVSLGVVRSLPSKLERLLSPEAAGQDGGGLFLARGEKNKIRLLKDSLQEMVDVYLLEPSSEVEGTLTSTARCWVKEVRELSYDIEDFLDELIHGHGAAAAAQKANLLGRLAKQLKVREGQARSRWIANETARFKSRLEEAIQRHKRYNLDRHQIPRETRADSADDEPEIPRRSRYGERARLVGIDGSMDTLEQWLAGDGERQLRVVSIVGPGGIGKTTLATELYRKLGREYQCRAFARSSQKPDLWRLLHSILVQVRRQQPLPLPSDVELGNLMDTIRACLQNKKYFIIIDDLWDASIWDIIHVALPDDKCCSRVLTTTEIDIVAQRCCGHRTKHIFNMEPLSDKWSNELFFSRFVAYQSGNCDENKVSAEIVRKCGGFPLAIIATANILARHQDQIEHCTYINRLMSSELRTNPTMEGIKMVVGLCYNNLPDRLKTCMLYLSIYKEGHIIWKDELIKQWISEGFFVCGKQGKHLEEIAERYFDELVNGGLIQPVDINYKGEVLSCTVHYIVHTFVRYMSIEENFVTAIDHSQTNTSLADKVRRLSLHFDGVDVVQSPTKLRLTHVRSLFFFGFYKSLPCIMDFRLLRVLNIHLWADQDNISLDLTTVCNFFRLKNLNIACNVTLNLQIQLHGLENLEILKIDSRVSEVPQEIVLLPSLVDLSIPGGTNLPNGIGHMASLHTLGHFDLCSNSADNVTSLGQLINVRDLRLTCSTIPCHNLEDNVGHLALALSKLSNLKSLNISTELSSNSNTVEANNSVSLDGLSSITPPALLEKLEFSPRFCIFSRLPRWIGELDRLSVIKVAARELRQSDIDVLSRLNALSALSLYVRTAPAGRIIFHKKAFNVLVYFKFNCSRLCLAFKKEAMPNVRRIKVAFSTNTLEKCIQDVGDAGFQNLTCLEVLSAKIGGAGCDESVRETVQSVLKDTFSQSKSSPIINIQLVDRVFYGDNIVVQTGGQTSKQPNVVTKSALQVQCGIGEFALREDNKMQGADNSVSNTLSLESSVTVENPDHHRDGNEFTRSNVILSGRDYGLQSNASPFSPNTNTVARHQHQSIDKESIVSDPNRCFTDPEKRELYPKSLSQQDEILLLRKKILYAHDNEQQLLREKHILERRLTDLMICVGEMQKDVLDGALIQLSQNREHLGENKRLQKELKVVKEEEYVFTYSLLRMLAEYNIFPPEINASTITTSTTWLYHQLHRRLRYSNGANRSTTLHQYDQGQSDQRAEQVYQASRFQQTSNSGPTTPSNYLKESSVTVDRELYYKHDNQDYPHDGDHLPGIEEFQIHGEARTGFKLTACGFPRNGTTLCMFQWVRYLDDGTKQCIQGATMPYYDVTVHDIGTLLAVNCTPMDDNGRQGHLVRKFANNGNKIA